MTAVRPRRETVVKLRASTAEAARWAAAAAEAGHPSLSSWVRCLADEAAATRGDGLAVARALTALRADLARGVGNDLDRIARRLHAGGVVGAPQIDALVEEVGRARAQITRRLRVVRPPRGRRGP